MKAVPAKASFQCQKKKLLNLDFKLLPILDPLPDDDFCQASLKLVCLFPTFLAAVSFCFVVAVAVFIIGSLNTFCSLSSLRAEKQSSRKYFDKDFVHLMAFFERENQR